MKLEAHRWDGEYWECLDCSCVSLIPCDCPCCADDKRIVQALIGTEA